MKSSQLRLWSAAFACALLLGACASPAAPSVPSTALPVVSTATLENRQPSPAPTHTFTPSAVAQSPTSRPTLTPAPDSTPATPQPPDQPVAGIEIPRLDQGAGLDLVKEAGAYWVRRNALPWSQVEPTPGARNWAALSGLETELKNASQSGLQVILIVRSTPGWAQKLPGVPCGPVAEEQIPAFASFMHDVVARYSQPPYNVRYWELGNEPDVAPELVPPESVFGCWGDLQDPYYGGRYYAQMLKAVYPQVKAADPQSKVVVGGLLIDCDPVTPPETKPGSGELKNCTPARFLEGILVNGGGDSFDLVSFHAYDFYGFSLGQYNNPNWHSQSTTTGPSLIAKARYLRSLLASFGQPGKGLLNTESALLCLGSQATCQSQDFELSKAYFAAQVYASAQAEGLTANIWFNLAGWRYSGLVEQKVKPLPAFDSFSFSAKMLDQAAFVRRLDESPGVMGYEFLRRGSRLWVLWSLDGAPHSLKLPGASARVYNVFGELQPASQTLEVGLAPLYIEWMP